MSTYNSFRQKQMAVNNCLDKAESSFIFEGTSATIIHSLRLDKDKHAALVITDKEGPDTSLVYTMKEKVKSNELRKGDYYTWNNNVYLVYEDVKIVRDAPYIKQKSYECNAAFAVNDICYYGYYVSSLAKYVDTTLEKELNIRDNEKPILILPQFDWVKLGVRIIIDHKPYKIIDYDYITNKGIVYCSLDVDFMIDEEETADSEDEELVGELYLVAGASNSVPTCFGYFKTDAEVEIVERAYDKVTFTIPYGVEEITIITKNASKEEVSTTYKVVI